jgi:hypothetical protein
LEARLAAAVARLLDLVYARVRDDDVSPSWCLFDHPGTEALVMLADALDGIGEAPEARMAFIEWMAEALPSVPLGAPPRAFQEALRGDLRWWAAPRRVAG